MNKRRILIADDDPIIWTFLKYAFKATDYDTLGAVDGLEALEIVEKENPDLVILDLVLPKLSGLQVCQRLRARSTIPIIMVSACGNEDEKIRCLDCGADDFVVKPFSAPELLARVNSVLRRSDGSVTVPIEPSVNIGNLSLDFNAKCLTLAGIRIPLTPTEFALLQVLVSNCGKVLDYEYLLNAVWGARRSGDVECLRVFVNRLRKKLEPETSSPHYVISVSGVGYMFERRSVASRVKHRRPTETSPQMET